jgi:hypothetical protein
MYFIGDIHGEWSRYCKIINQLGNYKSIQLGDFGVGFITPDLNLFQSLSKNHKFIRGNHDDPKACKTFPNFLGDWGYIETEDIFYVGGGASIDWYLRIPGKSWWEDEELSREQMTNAVDLYAKIQPRIVCSHDCPESVVSFIRTSIRKQPGENITRLGLAEMFSIHMPEIWVFAHWHKSLVFKVGHTQFHCLNINEIKEIGV